MKNKTSINPWLWVPTLYFAEGIPYFLVINISVAIFSDLGVPNGQMSLFTTLISLPWSFKFLWAPFIDMFKTKRWWTIGMQLLMVAAFVLLTLTIPYPSPEEIKAGTSIGLFWVMLFLFTITAFASATHDIAADGFYMIGLEQHEQAAFVGIRSMFYRFANIFGNAVLMGIAGMLQNHYEGNVPKAWQMTLLITAVLFAAFALWHLFFMPKAKNDVPSETKRSTQEIFAEFGKTFITYFQKSGIWLAIIFMLLYRLPEAFLMKMIYPFLTHAREVGGLALDKSTYALVYGAVGVIFLTVGGILGGIYASKVGLKKSLWWMAAAMTLPCLSFVYLSTWMPTSTTAIAIAIAIEQFGYGFGFTAYMLYMMYISEGESKTAHYAICTAFMALSMLLPGMIAGYIQEAIGYQAFFWMVIACCSATLAVTVYVRRAVDESYGRDPNYKEPTEEEKAHRRFMLTLGAIVLLFAAAAFAKGFIENKPEAVVEEAVIEVVNEEVVAEEVIVNDSTIVSLTDSIVVETVEVVTEQ